MALSTTPTYLTAAEFKANTRIQDQRTLANHVLNPYILHAERIIDAYIGYVEPYESGQSMKFPTKDEDGNSLYPDDMKLACIEIVQDLILQGEKELAGIFEPQSQEWTASGYKVTYKNIKSGQEVSLKLPPFAARLLRQWAGNSCALTFGF